MHGTRERRSAARARWHLPHNRHHQRLQVKGKAKQAHSLWQIIRHLGCHTSVITGA